MRGDYCDQQGGCLVAEGRLVLFFGAIADGSEPADRWSAVMGLRPPTPPPTSTEPLSPFQPSQPPLGKLNSLRSNTICPDRGCSEAETGGFRVGPVSGANPEFSAGKPGRESHAVSKQVFPDLVRTHCTGIESGTADQADSEAPGNGVWEVGSAEKVSERRMSEFFSAQHARTTVTEIALLWRQGGLLRGQAPLTSDQLKSRSGFPRKRPHIQTTSPSTPPPQKKTCTEVQARKARGRHRGSCLA